MQSNSDSPTIVQQECTNFEFKFISRHDFNSIYKSVQRRRRKELEKKKWDLFLAKKMEEENRKIKLINSLAPAKCRSCLPTKCAVLDVGTNVIGNTQSTGKSMQNEMEFPQKGLSSYRQQSRIEQLSFNQAVHIDDANDWEVSCSSDIKDTERRSWRGTELKYIKESNERVSLPNLIEDGCRLGNKSLDQISLEYDFAKIEELRSKILLSSDKILKILKSGPKFSEKEDIIRINLRSNEFSARFKRNYLYRVQCNVNEIKKLLDDKQKALKETLVQKVIAGHNSCVQALQVMEKHLPKVKVDASFNIFNDFFLCMCELTEKYKQVFGLPKLDRPDEVVVLCESIMDAMIDLVKAKPLKIKPVKVQKKPKDNLWMYANKNSWKNQATSLAKMKFGSKNLKNNQTKVPSAPAKSLITNQSTLSTVGAINKQKSKLNVRKREEVADDEIKTMVELTKLDSDNSEINDELQLDVNPVLDGPIVNGHDANEPQKLETVSSASAPITNNSNVNGSSLHVQRSNTHGKNVALICLKSTAEGKAGNASEERELVNLGDEEEEYRKVFKKYKESNLWYENDTLEVVTRLSAVILKDAISSVIEECGNTILLNDETINHNDSFEFHC